MTALTDTYQRRRDRLETYFDRTAADAWAKLTSDAPVNRIRATVRAGRDDMRGHLLSWLPDDLRGKRILDAGCGTGLFATEAARRGAIVTAVDISPTLIRHAQERVPAEIGEGRVTFVVGDMLDPQLGTFDHVVAMDSLIHYQADDVVRSLDHLTGRVAGSMVFTFAPSTPLLTVMHAVGQVFPRGNRSPEIVPVSERRIRRSLAGCDGLGAWRVGRTHRVTSGFYISQGLEIRRC